MTSHYKPENNPLAEDLDHILYHTRSLWEELRGKRLFITGGTGFFGAWLLESFVWINTKLELDASVLVLTRNYEAFRQKLPHIASNPAIQFHIGDIRDFIFPKGDFSHIIHAATTSAISTFNNLEDSIAKYDTIGGGTKRALDFAVQCHAEKFLLTSSGVVYGRQLADMVNIPESIETAPEPTDPVSVVGESKRVSELLCVLYSKRIGIESKIARCFSFVGPYLPLDLHYAIGNFIRDGLKGGPIQIHGDGTPCRSYLYASDLMIWLWTILFRGESCRAYNVGSEEGITIAEAAHLVAQSFQIPIEVKIAKIPSKSKHMNRYVPSTKRAQAELGIGQQISLQNAIKKTIAYYAGANKISSMENI